MSDRPRARGSEPAGADLVSGSSAAGLWSGSSAAGPRSGSSAAFRPLADGDLPQLVRWLNAPHVAEWWDEPHDLETARAHYGPRIDGREPVHCWIAHWCGQPVGMVQNYLWSSDPQLAAIVGAASSDAGIDYLIGEVEVIGRGIGARLLAAFLDTIVLAADPPPTGVRVDVNAANRRSRRTLEKLGFTLAADRDFSEDGHDYVVYAR